MEINTVKFQQNGYLVNGIQSVPLDENNSDYIKIQNWILGKTESWLELENIHNQEVKNYNNWLKIKSYDADLVQYQSDINVYLNWTFSDLTPVRPDLPLSIPKPDGYYTLEEVDESITKHNEWNVEYNKWLIDTDINKPTHFWITEPPVFQLPVNIPEPIVAPLPPLVPNIVNPEFSLNDLKENKINDLKNKCTVDIESGFSSSVVDSTYTYESTIKDQLNLTGSVQLNIDIDYTVIDNTNKKIRVTHTAAQIQQVFNDGVIVKQTKIDKLYTLLSQVEAATDEDTLNSIIWS